MIIHVHKYRHTVMVPSSLRSLSTHSSHIHSSHLTFAPTSRLASEPFGFRHMLSCCHPVLSSYTTPIIYNNMVNMYVTIHGVLRVSTQSLTRSFSRHSLANLPSCVLPTSSAEWIPPCVFQASVDRREGGGSLGRVDNANHREDWEQSSCCF